MSTHAITVLSRAQLTAAVKSIFPNADVQAPYDLAFALANRDQLTSKFAEEFYQILNALGGEALTISTPWDCDKFARTASVLVLMKHAIAQRQQALHQAAMLRVEPLSGDTAPEGVAFGVLSYRWQGQGHAANVLVSSHGVEVWEPQTCHFSLLTQAERESAWLAQF